MTRSLWRCDCETVTLIGGGKGYPWQRYEPELGWHTFVDTNEQVQVSCSRCGKRVEMVRELRMVG